jgi:hypothetical protein
VPVLPDHNDLIFWRNGQDLDPVWKINDVEIMLVPRPGRAGAHYPNGKEAHIGALI